MTHDFLKRSLLAALCAVGLLGLGVLPASAQATRTWVSGVGDDANPCSRTAPCKTFAGAISKTAPAGEINVLDPGGFGALTITKSITVSSVGFEAGVLVSGTNGIVVSAGVNDQIILVGLDFEGLGTGLDGLKILGGAQVHVHNCAFHHFTTSGIHLLPNAGNTAASYLLVTDSRLDGNAVGVAVSSNSASAPAVAFLDNVTIMGSFPSSGTTGIAVDGTQGSLVLNNSTVVRNTTGLSETNSGQLFSFANNRVVQNSANGAPNQTNLTFE